MAPSTKATAQGGSGISTCATTATTRVVMRTRPSILGHLMVYTYRLCRAVPHAAAYDAVHDDFMKLAPYTRKRRGRGTGVGLWREKRLSQSSISSRLSNTRAPGTGMSSRFRPRDSSWRILEDFPTSSQ